MRIIICIIFILIFLSCVDDYTYFDLPQTVLLNFSVINEMDASVSVKIRHKYSWGRYKGCELINTTLYSEWSEVYCINSEENKLIGVEKVMVSNEKKTWELEGFILLDEVFRYNQQNPLLSSFDIEITTIDNSFIITGYTEVSEKSINTDLCVLQIINPYNTCFFYTNKQILNIQGIPFVLPVILIIHSDGSYSFEHEAVEEGKGIIVIPEM